MTLEDKEAQEARIQALFSRIAEGYDGANDRISLGLHRRWKGLLCRDAARHLPFGGQLLDLCCGTGDIALSMAALRPDASVTGLDLTGAMLDIARRRGAGLDNAAFLQGDALDLPFPAGTFDAVTVGFGLRNTPDFRAALVEAARVTRRDGWIYILESSTPRPGPVYLGYRAYFSTVMPVLGGGFRHHDAYRWLHTSTWAFPSKDKLLEELKTAGFREAQYRSLLWGCAAIHMGQKT